MDGSRLRSSHFADSALDGLYVRTVSGPPSESLQQLTFLSLESGLNLSSRMLGAIANGISRILSTSTILDDMLLQLPNPSNSMDTSTFFTRHLHLPDPLAAMNRFFIESIILVTNVPAPSQHEYLRIAVSDTQCPSPNIQLLFIKQPTWNSRTRVTGQDDIKYNGHRQVVRQIKPKGLNLFELALLAGVVEKQGALYSIFKNQPYWYANLICNAVVALYTCEEQDDRGVIYSHDDVCVPPGINGFPQLVGQWINIPVSGTEATMLAVVLTRFKEVCTPQIDRQPAEEVETTSQKI